MLEIMLELCSIMPAKWRNKRNRHKNVDYCEGYLLNFRVRSVLFSLFAEYEKIDANYAEYTEYLQIMPELCQLFNELCRHYAAFKKWSIMLEIMLA